MAELDYQSLYSDRIGGKAYGTTNEIYKFEKIKRAKRQAMADFPDRPLIDFGIGENDEMADPLVRSQMKEEIDRPENRGYADNGIAEFRVAASSWMKKMFGVQLDPETEVNHCIGSKTALSMIPAAFINPGDVTLMTVPGYPILGTHTKYYGGKVHPLPLSRERNFLPDLASVPAEVLERTKILVLNYPNSPTGALADGKFFESVVRFAKEHNILVVNDAAHIMLTYGKRPLSFLEVDGARDVGIEVHSLSKGFHMIGWRLGFIAGQRKIVRAVADVKDNCDSGQFIAIQKAGIAALADDSIPLRVREKYERRLLKLVQVLRELGFQADMPGGTYFLYVPAPAAAEHMVTGQRKTFSNAEDASQYLIREHSICTVPWDDAGKFLRFSVTYSAPQSGIDEASGEDILMKSLAERLHQTRFVF